MYNLQRRRISRSNLCPLCNQGKRRLNMCLLLCDLTERVWFRALDVRMDKRNCTTLSRWVQEFSSSLTMAKSDKREILARVAFTVRQISKSHNDFVYKKNICDPLTCVVGFLLRRRNSKIIKELVPRDKGELSIT